MSTTIRGVGGNYRLVPSPSGEVKMNVDHPGGQLSLFRRLGPGTWQFFNFHTQEYLDVEESEIVTELDSVYDQLTSAERKEREAARVAEKSRPIDAAEIMQYATRCVGAKLTRLVLSTQDGEKTFAIDPATYNDRRFAGLAPLGLVYVNSSFNFSYIALPRANGALVTQVIRRVLARAEQKWRLTPQWRARQRLLESGTLFD